MEVKTICENFVLMKLTNILVFSGDFIRDINMKIHVSLALETQNCSTRVPLLKLQLKKINDQNHKRALGAKEGVPNEDATWEYENFCSVKTWNLFRTRNIEWGGLSCPQLNNFQIRLFANNVSPTY